MRKRRKQWKKNRKYLFLWIGLVILFFLGFLFPIGYFYRGFFADTINSFRDLYSFKEVTLSNYLDQELEAIKKENEQLRNLLSYKESFASFTVIPTSVLSRGNDWDEVLTINVGKKEGADIGMAVVSEKGLVGRVVEVYASSSLVQLLTRPLDTNQVAVSVHSENGTFSGILQGYDSSTNDFLVSLFHPGEVSLGSSVSTNGLGSFYPSNIPVGSVREITKDTLGITTVLRVSPSVNFDFLGYLFVLAK